jgi:hypothetical protein
VSKLSSRSEKSEIHRDTMNIIISMTRSTMAKIKYDSEKKVLNISIYKLISCSSALLEKPPVVQLLKNSQHFMKPKGSLPCSQKHNN